jgi:hypothetical protein
MDSSAGDMLACSTGEAMKQIQGSKTIGEFADLLESGRLDLFPSFRRESAKEPEPRWTVGERRLLIQEFLRDGFGARTLGDEIYIRRRDDGGGNPTYEVFHNHRFLETLLSFVLKGPLARETKQDGRQNRSAEWSGWGEISEESRAAFLATSLPTIEVVDVDRAGLISWYEHLSYQSRVFPLERRLEQLTLDRTHGATTLARKALRILDEVPRNDWATIAPRLVLARPSMPLIGIAVSLALQIGDPEAVIKRLERERRKVAERAAEALVGYTSGVTISNSSAVANALRLSAIRNTQVVVAGPADEGYAMVKLLRRAGISAKAVSVGESDAAIGLVGCDALFTDGSFVNRLGTAELARQLAPRVVLVLAESLKWVDHAAPTAWPEPELFEIVRPAANIQIISVDLRRPADNLD